MARLFRKNIKTDVETGNFADEEEEQLFRNFKRGIVSARDKLLVRYSEWVSNIAKKYHTCFTNIDLSELIAEGNRGLLEALNRYDATRHVRFSTYAWFWIIKNIQEYITSDIAMIELPHKISADLRKISKTMNEELRNGRVPSLERISKKLELDLNTIRELLLDKRNLSNLISLDKYLDDDERTQTLVDILEDKNEDTVQEIVDELNKDVSISDLLQKLNPIEKNIIKLRFGFQDNKFHSLREIGNKFRISSAKVKDIEAVAIIKLKRFLENMYEKI